jgi:hypothetical protein
LVLLLIHQNPKGTSTGRRYKRGLVNRPEIFNASAAGLVFYQRASLAFLTERYRSA